jgi:ribosome-associated toxin RatA of RatAB toxin-antitoxin module
VKRVARSAIVEHSAATLFALVDDVEAYPEFLPWCLSAKVHARDSGRTLATITVGIKGIRQSFTTENANLPGERIDMRLVEGPFKHFAASWRFVPLGECAARIEFRMEYEFSSRLLAKLLDPLFGHIADTMVGSFSRRAEALHGQAPAN